MRCMRRPLRPGRPAAGKKNHAISKWKQRFSTRKAAHKARQADAERAISPFKCTQAAVFTVLLRTVRQSGKTERGSRRSDSKHNIYYYILYILLFQIIVVIVEIH